MPSFLQAPGERPNLNPPPLVGTLLLRAAACKSIQRLAPDGLAHCLGRHPEIAVEVGHSISSVRVVPAAGRLEAALARSQTASVPEPASPATNQPDSQKRWTKRRGPVSTTWCRYLRPCCRPTDRHSVAGGRTVHRVVRTTRHMDRNACPRPIPMTTFTAPSPNPPRKSEPEPEIAETVMAHSKLQTVRAPIRPLVLGIRQRATPARIIVGMIIWVLAAPSQLGS